MANVSLLVSNVVRTFAPPALPSFIAIPVPIPRQSSSATSSASRLIVHTRPSSHRQPRTLAGEPWFVTCRYILLGAVGDPGEENTMSSGPLMFLLPAAIAKASAFPLTLFRGLLPDSASLASPRILSAAPCVGFGWLTTPFPAGYAPARQETISRSTARLYRSLREL